MMGCRFSPCDESSAETGEVEILRRNHNGANCDADTKLATVEGLTSVKGRLVGDTKGFSEKPERSHREDKCQG